MSAAFLAHLLDLCEDAGRATVRPMFGGYGLYVDQDIVGIVIDEALYLKADARTQATFEAAGGAPYVYLGQRRPITMSYWSLPEEALESAEALRPWLRLAREAAARKGRRRGS